MTATTVSHAHYRAQPTVGVATHRDTADGPLHFQIGVIGLTLRTSIRSVRREFRKLYASHQLNCAPQRAIEVQVDRVRPRVRPKPWYRLLLFGEEYKTFRRGGELLPQIEWAVNSAILSGHAPYYALHASVLQREDMGFVFPGSPGSGKSTLAAALLARGWKYLGDEFALLDPRTRLLQPYPKAICAKAGSWPILKQLGLPLNARKRYVKALKGPVSFLSPVAVRPDSVGSPCPVRAVILPEHVPEAAPQLVPISRAECAFLLSDQSFNSHSFPGRGLGLLADVVRGARCYRLRSGEINRTCNLVDELHDELAEGVA